MTLLQVVLLTMSAHTTIYAQPHGLPGTSRFSDMKKKLVEKMEDFMTAGNCVNPTEEQLELAGQLACNQDESRYAKIPFGSIIRHNRVSSWYCCCLWQNSVIVK